MTKPLILLPTTRPTAGTMDGSARLITYSIPDVGRGTSVPPLIEPLVLNSRSSASPLEAEPVCDHPWAID